MSKVGAETWEWSGEYFGYILVIIEKGWEQESWIQLEIIWKRTEMDQAMISGGSDRYIESRA